MIAARLRALPHGRALGIEVPVAAGPRARLLGLAGLDRAAAGRGLLIPRCSSVHTFGMRFALDVYFLAEDGSPIAARRGVPPRRVVGDRGAAAVLEVPASSVDLSLAMGSMGGEPGPPGAGAP